MEGEKIYLAVEMLSVNQMAYHFNREIPGKRFFDPEVRFVELLNSLLCGLGNSMYQGIVCVWVYICMCDGTPP